MSAEGVIGVVCVAFLVVGVVTDRSANVEVRKRWYRGLSFAAVPLLLAFLYSIGTSAIVCLAVAPIAAVLVYVHLRSISFCSRCGARTMHPGQDARFCLRCGSPLGDTDRAV